VFPNRVHVGSDTLSLEPLVYFSFIHLYMSARVPKAYPIVEVLTSCFNVKKNSVFCPDAVFMYFTRFSQ